MSWAHYLLQANLYLVVFFGFYKLLLDKETYFILNRIYLVSAGVLSLALPFLRFEWFTTQSVAQPMYVGFDQLNEFIQVSAVAQPVDYFNIGNFAVLIYLGGVLFSICRFIFQLFSVHSLLKKARPGSAFSFFNKKIIDKDLPQLQTIHMHEETHIRQLHTLDILFFEMAGIITWFNPIIYLYKNTIRNIHEYLADEEAAKFQGDKEQYALLLLSSALGIKPNQLTNSFFNKSLIKKRIFMLHKQRSRKIAILKYGLFVPLFAIMLVLSSATIRENQKIQAVADEIPLEKPLTIVKDLVNQVVANPIASSGTEQSDPKWEDFYKFIKMRLKYPAAAQASNLQGNSQVKFTIKNGEIEGLGIAAKSLGSGCDTEVMKTVLAYEGFKNNANGKYLLNVRFRINNVNTPILNEKATVLNGYTTLGPVTIMAYPSVKSTTAMADSADNKIYSFIAAETHPSFPGGMARFYKFLQQNLRYPVEAKKNNVQGKVFLSFIVERNGELTDINVIRKLGSGLDEEAIRVIKASPKWTPGIKDGRAVRVKYSLPISFNLSDPLREIDSSFFKTPSDFLNKTGAIPMIIIDGVKSDKTNFKRPNASDILSIDILKDTAATSRYGADGKNGVIVITTKKAKAASSPKEN